MHGMIRHMTVQDQKIKSAEQCLTMFELRAAIDRVDLALVTLLSQRQRYIERAAEIKAHAREIRDEARIADVLAKVTQAAAAAGLDVEIAGAVWRTLMERSIALERNKFEEIQRCK